jgi:hypothetical protein
METEENIKKEITHILTQLPLNKEEQGIWQDLILKIEPADKLVSVLKDIKEDSKAVRAYTDYFLKVKKAFEAGDSLMLEELYNNVFIEKHIENYRKFLKFKLASWDLKNHLINQE